MLSWGTETFIEVAERPLLGRLLIWQAEIVVIYPVHQDPLDPRTRPARLSTGVR